MLRLMLALAAAFTPLLAHAADPQPWWKDDVTLALNQAKGNRASLEKALHATPAEHRKAMTFLLVNMPAADLKALSGEFLLENIDLAYKARKVVPWGKEIPEELFFNDVLPYANVDESRDPWRKEFFEMCLPLVRDCKTAGEAAHKLNSELFGKLKVGYSTQRKKPNQSPKESIEQGKASCTGLSIILSNACRSVCVPARLVGTPLWTNKRGNHTWVEIWDKTWHFTGACEADKQGLDRGWFVGDAAKAQKDVPEHAIYAASFAKTKTPFPLVWAPGQKDVTAVNVTDHYAKPVAPAGVAQLQIRVWQAGGKVRAIEPVNVVDVQDAKQVKTGTSRGETADRNDILTFDLPPSREFKISSGGVEKTVRTPMAGQQLLVELELPKK